MPHELILFFKNLMVKTSAEQMPEAQERLCSIWAHLTLLSLYRHGAPCPGVRLHAEIRPEDGEKTNPALPVPPFRDGLTVTRA